MKFGNNLRGEDILSGYLSKLVNQTHNREYNNAKLMLRNDIYYNASTYLGEWRTKT